MKRILMILLLLISLPSFADDSSAGNVYINVNTGVATLQNLSTSSWTGSVNLGYDFNHYVALEGGYNLLSNGQYGGASNIFDLAAKGMLPLSSVFSLYGRLGVGYVTDFGSGSPNTTTSSGCYMCGNNYNSNYATALFGIGGSFMLSKHFDLNIDGYAFIPFSSNLSGGVNVVTLGAQYNF